MCELCDNIPDYETIDYGPFAGTYTTYSILVRDPDTKTFDIYWQCCDCPSSGPLIENIHYCPKCGRKLKED